MRRRSLWPRLGVFLFSGPSFILMGSVVSLDAEQPRFRVKLAVTYEQGDFGTAETTRTLFAPLTLQYLGDQFDLGVTVPFIAQETGPGVVAVEGAPQPCSSSGRGNDCPDDDVAAAKQTAAGLGDIVVKGRYYLIDDRGALPAVSPFAKVKFPTADDQKGLGTGELDWGFGVELEKRVGSFILFGDVG